MLWLRLIHGIDVIRNHIVEVSVQILFFAAISQTLGVQGIRLLRVSLLIDNIGIIMIALFQILKLIIQFVLQIFFPLLFQLIIEKDFVFIVLSLKSLYQ